MTAAAGRGEAAQIAGPASASTAAARRLARRRTLQATLAGALTWLFAGCAGPGAQHARQVISGRLFLRVPEDDQQQPARPAQSLTVLFELDGNAERGQLRLLSAFGTVLALASWWPGTATLQTSEGERRFDSLDSLAQAALGEPLPLAALPDWLNGQPWAGTAHVVRERGFEQAGWQVLTDAFAEGRIEALRLARPQAMLRVQLDTAH
jgi:outer membrane lipoprotein LolB